MLHGKRYSEEKLWKKVRNNFRTIGKSVLKPVLLLYYSLENPETPAWAKSVIYGALVYFIVPLDAIPDFTPVAGYVDDLGVLTAAIRTVIMYIDDEVRRKADEKLAKWFESWEVL